MEFIELVRLYIDLMTMQIVDIRVIEAVVRMIESYVPARIEVNLDHICEGEKIK